MSDKKSQNTEEEMLEQTFVGYDEEMTVQTEDNTKDNASSTSVDTAVKKKNQNLLIFGAMGVAAVGFLGFKFLNSGNPAQQQSIQEPIQTQQQVQPPVVQPQPPVVQPQPPVVQPQAVASNPVAATTEPVTVPAPIPINPVQSTIKVENQTISTSAVDSIAKYNGNTNNVSLPKNDTKIETKSEVNPEVKKVNIEKTEAVTAYNAEANSNNEKLLAQFQEMLDKKYDPKFEKIEKSLDEQKEFNKSIEERLSKLEAGKSTKITTKTSNELTQSSENTSSSGTKSNDVKPINKIIRKPVIIRNTKHVVKKNTEVEDEDIIVDKSFIKIKPEIKKTEPEYPKIEIYSVYSGRIWTKNSDGTLSTFTVGDRLPTGEVIKKIDEEKETIITDKRVISQ
jgi:hypothetical protein